MESPGWRMCLCQKLLFEFITILILRVFSFLGWGVSGKTGWAGSLKSYTWLHGSHTQCADVLQWASSMPILPNFLLPSSSFIPAFFLSTPCPPHLLPVLLYFLSSSSTSCPTHLLLVLLSYFLPLLLLLDFLFYFRSSSFTSHPPHYFLSSSFASFTSWCLCYKSGTLPSCLSMTWRQQQWHQCCHLCGTFYCHYQLNRTTV